MRDRGGHSALARWLKARPGDCGLMRSGTEAAGFPSVSNRHLHVITTSQQRHIAAGLIGYTSGSLAFRKRLPVLISELAFIPRSPASAFSNPTSLRNKSVPGNMPRVWKMLISSMA